MTTLRDDFNIDDLLADSLVRATMRADGVDPIALRSLLDSAARRVQASTRRRAFVAYPRPEIGASRGALVLYRPPSELRRLSLAETPRQFDGAFPVGPGVGQCESGLCW